MTSEHNGVMRSETTCNALHCSALDDDAYISTLIKDVGDRTMHAHDRLHTVQPCKLQAFALLTEQALGRLFCRRTT
jgi:hypothetical protein